MLLVVAALSFGVLALIARFADFRQVRDALAAANPAWFVLCGAGVVVIFLGYALAYRGFVRVADGPDLPFSTALRVSLAAVGAGVVAASVGTLAVGFWAIRREGVSGSEATRRLLAMSTYQWFVLGWAAVACGCLLLVTGADAMPIAMVVVWIVLVPTATVIGLLASGPERRARTDSWAKERATARAGTRRARLTAVVRGAYAEAIGGLVLMRAVLRAPARHPAGVVGFPLYWLGHTTVVIGALRSVDVQIGLPALLVAFTTGYVASGVPLPGGAGSVDAGLALALAAVRVPLAEAVVATLVYRFFTLWLPVVPALVVAPGLARRLDAVRRTQPSARFGRTPPEGA